MKEEKRIGIVEAIKDKLKIDELIKEKESQINELLKDEKIILYLALKEEIEELNQKKNRLLPKDQMINLEFFKEFNNECNHDMYVYIGSYRMDYGFPNKSCLKEGKISNETCVNFSFNKYMCLSCGLIREVSNWEEFEANNIVFKNYKYIDVTRYRQLYFELLFNYPVEVAKELLIKEYMKKENLENSKKLIKTK